MDTSKQLAKHLKDVFFGGNWTVSNLSNVLEGITWQQAIKKVDSFNTIATLTYHIHYFVNVASRVLEEGVLEGNDKLSFNHPPIHSQEDWEALKQKVFTAAKRFSALITELPEDKLFEDFTNEKYGSYFRNILGIIEHIHYHLGQIALLKKLT
jgi:phytoene dehydrogenase-like protein